MPPLKSGGQARSLFGGFVDPPHRAAMDAVAAVLASGFARRRVREAIIELSRTEQARAGNQLEPRLDLELLDDLRALERVLTPGRANRRSRAQVQHPMTQSLEAP